MRVLQVHNEYQLAGGEEVVVAAEHAMLTQYGHEVQQWIVKNSALKRSGILQKAAISFRSIWSKQSFQDMQKKLQDFRPDVVHVHNTIPLLTPSIYSACHESGVPVVQTLHNYKFICPGSNLYRNDRVCEDCVGKSFLYPALAHGCYRRDRLSTTFAVASLTANRLRGTYQNDIDIYIALTEFARNKFIEGGLPPEKIVVKPNFISHTVPVGKHAEQYALFVGRLIPQKGVKTLIRAWSLLKTPIPLKIVGKGPLEEFLQSNLPPNVEYLGAVPRDQVLELMRSAKLFVFPTEWYEVFGLVLIEALAAGLPIVASRIGGVTEIVKEGVSGWHFTSGDAEDLASKLQVAWSDSERLEQFSISARNEYEQNFTLDKNYQRIMEIYQMAIARFKTGLPA